MSVSVSVCHVSINLSNYLSICLCPSVYRSVCLSVSLSVCLSVGTSVRPSACVSICMSVCAFRTTSSTLNIFINAKYGNECPYSIAQRELEKRTNNDCLRCLLYSPITWFACFINQTHFSQCSVVDDTLLGVVLQDHANIVWNQFLYFSSTLLFQLKVSYWLECVQIIRKFLIGPTFIQTTWCQ